MSALPFKKINLITLKKGETTMGYTQLSPPPMKHFDEKTNRYIDSDYPIGFKTVEDLRNYIRDNVLSDKFSIIDFTKVDDTNRILNGRQGIKKYWQKKDNKGKAPRKISRTCINMFDLDKSPKGYRSINVERINSIRARKALWKIVYNTGNQNKPNQDNYWLFKFAVNDNG